MAQLRQLSPRATSAAGGEDALVWFVSCVRQLTQDGGQP